jgi:phosphatidylserine decarboxylase
MARMNTRRPRRVGGWLIFATLSLCLLCVLALLRFSVVTDYMYHSMVKDPERTAPTGNVIVAPADGTVLYITPIKAGTIPEVVKRGVPVPLADHLKLPADRDFADGFLIGIYMNSDGVHINRIPIGGTVEDIVVFNGPHIGMSDAERTIILTQLMPGWVSLKKLLGWPPYEIEAEADFILKSARETLVLEDVRGSDVYIVRIADFTIGKILTWVEEGERVETGQKLGMITWGSQTDIYFEVTPGLAPQVDVGDFVYAGETILATY